MWNDCLSVLEDDYKPSAELMAMFNGLDPEMTPEHDSYTDNDPLEEAIDNIPLYSSTCKCLLHNLRKYYNPLLLPLV